MKKAGYIVIQDWMLDLPLSLVETAIYAIIYGFSQDGESTYSGSLGYLARKAKVSKDTARRAIHKLTEEGYIELIVVPVNGVIFNTYKVKEGGSNLQGGIAICKEGGSNLPPNNKEIYKDINIISNKASRAFIPPTLHEVADYCAERGNSVSAERFINHYESNGWMVGKNKMKDWRAAVRTWEQRETTGRSAGKPKQSRAAMYDQMAAIIFGGTIDEQ